MTSLPGLILGATMLLAAPAMAGEPAPPAASERRLTPQQIEAVLAEAAKKREATEQALPETVEQDVPRQVHGEVGVSLGTGGYREAHGTGVYPIGDEGAAAISMDYVRLGRRRPKN